MKSKFKIFGISISSTILLSCQTTSYVAKVDKSKKKIEIQSQADDGSAIYALQRKGVLNNVKSDLKSSIKNNEKDVKSLINLSQVYLAQGNFEKAESYCRKALKYDLGNLDAKLTLAQIYYRRGFVDMTEIILNSLGKKVEKDSIALNLKGLVALKNDRPAYAMNFFKTALKYNPGDIATRMNLGVLYVYYRQVDAAAVQFERVLKSMPKHVDANLHLAVIKASRGQFEEAENLYKDVLDVDKQNALATYNLAVLEEKRSNFDDSLGYLKEYLSSNYAKRQGNKEVFAMIERLRAKKDMQGETVSDAEIRDLTGQLSQPLKPDVAILEDDEEEEEKVQTKVKAKKKKPATINKPKVTKLKEEKAPERPKEPDYDDDDIESLEKALIE